MQAALTALFALDERLGAIVAATGEPAIGLLRLAWWREALAALDAAPPPPEPLLRALAGEVLPRGVTGAILAEIEDGWAALLDGEGDAGAITRHGAERGVRLFAAAARLLGAHDDRLAAAGAGWALADLARRHSGAKARAEARRQASAALAGIGGARWPAAARPLAMLAVLARDDAGRAAPARQGSPSRIARMLALRWLGR